MSDVFAGESFYRMTATTSSASVAVPAGVETVVITSALSDAAVVCFGRTAATAAVPAGNATGSGYWVAPGSVQALAIPPGSGVIAAVAKSGTGDLVFAWGYGA